MKLKTDLDALRALGPIGVQAAKEMEIIFSQLRKSKARLAKLEAEENGNEVEPIEVWEARFGC